MAGGANEAGSGAIGPHLSDGTLLGARLGLDCVLELHLNELGCTEGWFEADGQRLEVSGGAPDARGEVSGLIRAATLLEPFALFRARADAQGLRLEVSTAPDTPRFERVAFVRLA